MYQAGMALDESSLGAPLDPPAQGVDPKYWQVEKDIKLYHFAGSSKGKRNILYIHGGPGLPPADPLAGLEKAGEGYTIQYYHQRGCGKSTRPIDRLSGSYYSNMQTLVKRLGFRAMLADVERIRRILGEEKLILVGHSFGGFFASLYAAEYPERVEKLILLSPAGVVRMPPPDGGLFGSIDRGLTGERKKEFAELKAKMLDFSNVFDKTDGEHRDLQNGWVPFYAEAFRHLRGREMDVARTPPEWTGGFSVIASYFDLGYRSDFRPFLQKIQAPTLVLYGDQDLSGPESFADYRIIPGARMVPLTGEDHFLVNRPEQKGVEIIRSFLQE